MEKKVLVVDESASVRESLERTLLKLDEVLHVDTAKDNKEGISRIQECSYDVLITDMKSRDLPGLTLLEELDEQRDTLHIPQFRIVTTEHDQVSILQKAIENGCYHYITKPYKLRDMRVIFYWMKRQYPTDFEPTVYVVGGTKGEGKSEVLIHLARYYGVCVPGKHSDREQEQRDQKAKDTRPLTEFLGIVRENINWRSYNYTCAISVDVIQEHLGNGYDVGIPVGQVEGVHSVLHHFPKAKVFILDMDDRVLETIINARHDNTIPLKDIKIVQQTFRKQFRRYLLKNRTFFDVAREISSQIYDHRVRSSKLFAL